MATDGRATEFKTSDFGRNTSTTKERSEMQEDISNWETRVIGWAKARNLIEGSSPDRQLIKLEEEFGELRAAVLTTDRPGTIDGIGDCCVVMAIIAEQLGLSFGDCLEYAWNEIKDRKGMMVNGIFVKEA